MLDKFFQFIVRYFTFFGNLFPQFLICCLLMLMDFHKGFQVFVIWFWGYAINFTIKNTVRRQRPPKETWKLLNHVNGLSFPSGHSLMSLVLYWSIAKYFVIPFPWAIPFYLMPFLLGLTRLYFRVHYISDVVAGWFIAFLYLVFCSEAVVLWHQKTLAYILNFR